MKILLVLSLLFFPINLAAQAQQQSRCKTQPEYRQFDFWVGEWEVKNPNGQVVGNSKIEPIIGDCVIFENWASTSGYVGKSLNYYNFIDQKWHQKWIGSGGVPIEFSGAYNEEEKRMEYKGTGTGQGGIPLINKLTFFHLNDDHIRQLWEQSTDEGETWTVAFDGHYHRKKAGK